MSDGCRPMDGSSSTYSVSTRCDPRAFERAMRCASPPDNVRVRRSSVRYPSPTSFTNESRAESSARMWTAIAWAEDGSSSCATQSRRAAAVKPATAAMLFPQTRTASASGLRRAPPQAGRSEEHTSELQSLAYLVCRLLLEKKKKKQEDAVD